MSDTAWRVLLVTAVAAAVLGACGYTLIGSRAVMPVVSDAAGPLFLTAEAMAERRVSQVFRVGFSGLDSVTVRFARGPADPFGPLVLELVEIRKGGATRVVRQESVPATRALSGSQYTFAFRPVETWEPTTFRLDVKMPSAPAGRGIRLFAVEGHHLPDSTLMVNDAEGFADLAFRTSTAWPTLWSRLVHHLRRPDWKTPDRGLLAALAVAAFASFVFVCGTVACGRLARL